MFWKIVTLATEDGRAKLFVDGVFCAFAAGIGMAPQEAPRTPVAVNDQSTGHQNMLQTTIRVPSYLSLFWEQ